MRSFDSVQFYIPSEHLWCLEVGWELARLEFIFDNENFDATLNAALAKTQRDLTERIKFLLAQHGYALKDGSSDFAAMQGQLLEHIGNRDMTAMSYVLLGNAGMRLSMAESTPNQETRAHLENLARSSARSAAVFDPTTRRRIFEALREHRVRSLADVEEVLSEVLRPTSSLSAEGEIRILFLSADPVNQPRLRLGEEVREIQTMLQLARYRERCHLEQRWSTRVEDLTQAIHDFDPNVLHFSGHGTDRGEICVEGRDGTSQPIPPEALGKLFSLSGGNLDCVLLNACFSAEQAQSISEHVHYVIGMNNEMGDSAAVAFAVGFYQALGAGRDIKDAFAYGQVLLSLHDLPDAIMPQLLTKP